jgi:hypothetical protein
LKNVGKGGAGVEEWPLLSWWIVRDITENVKNRREGRNDNERLVGRCHDLKLERCIPELCLRV